MLTLIQALWAVLLALWGSFLAWNGHSSGAPFLLVAGAHAYITFRMHKGAKWAWWASWPLPSAALILAGPMVVKNFYMYFTDHPLYLDSPGTINAVAVSGLIFVVPAIGIVCLLIAKRRSLAPNKSLERTREE